MAKVESVDIPDELKTLERKALERRDRFVLGAIQGHKRIPSKIQKKLIKERSLFGFFSLFWRELTTEEKATWADAAQYSGLTNWQLFISDNAARLRNELGLDVPPSELWQVNAGHIVLAEPANQILLRQDHPLDYWVAQKVVGASWKRELVKITETFSLPLTIAIRYKSDLTATGGAGDYTPPLGNAVDFELEAYTPPASNAVNFSFGAGGIARYWARVWTSYQGQDIQNDFAIDFEPQQDWTFETLEISGLRGIIIGYTLYLEIEGYTGSLLFDNIRAEHGGTNWALDPRCDEINKTFKKAFAVVPPFWVPEVLPEGVSFSSSYPPSLS